MTYNTNESILKIQHANHGRIIFTHFMVELNQIKEIKNHAIKQFDTKGE